MPKPPWTPAPSAPFVVAPSILSADFGHLHDQIRSAELAGAGWIHVDVMDGHFVPNITIGPLVVHAVRRATQLPVDVHLMVSHPDPFLEDFVRAGADVLTVHVEACTHLQRTLRRIRELGAAAGVALNPHTPEGSLAYVLDDLDLVLAMTVNPGFGGQAFLPSVLPKVAALRKMIDEKGLPIVLEVDGGVAPGTAALVARAGARVLVAGSAVFGAPDLAAAIHSIRDEAERARQRVA
jgi:ribulose-phosphate 3-epimerase